MKPRIKICRLGDVALWCCSYDGNPGSYGGSPKEAYELWLVDLPF